MKKCLIWGTGTCFSNNLYLIQYYELAKIITVVGITSNQTYYDSILSYRFISKENIGLLEYDYLVIAAAGNTAESIKKEALNMGISEMRIVPISVMHLPNFDFEKYQKIMEHPPTIFAPSCWGGITYHNLGLKFRSPFINMFESHNDYIKFLKNPRFYIEQTLEFVEMKYERNLKREYPVARCYDILLYFNHYISFEEAVDCWNRRKKRIDWDNLLIMYYDENVERVQDFLSLPYKNKICFVPFQSHDKNVIFVEYNKDRKNVTYGEIVNGTAPGKGLYYDVFELMLNHKVVPLAKVK